MLGKLLKHEWRAVWKVPTLLIGVLMIIAVAAGCTFALPIWDSEWIGLPLSGVMMIVIFYFAMIAVGIGITIYFAVRYYKNMYTDEGYLTHTLPVSARSLLLNKVITMTAWNLIGGVAIIVSIFVFGGVTLLALMPKDSSYARELVEAFVQLPAALRELWNEPALRGINGFCASIVFLVLASAFSGTMMVIGSITLGQMVRKHRILGAVGAYFAINCAMQFLTTIIIMPVMMMRINSAIDDMYMDVSPFPVMTPMYIIIAVVSLGIAIGLYFMSEYLVRRRLELE
ncbi:MAG: hypothetical protein K2N55_08845 [Lachnospiraceae bacterium]|nr:hypothetical protein [Lachnospiraceae bacterium]